MNFMKMRTFYKNSNLILIKNSNLKYELSKKLHFLELLETPDLRSALREAYPPNSRRQSSSEEDGEWMPSSHVEIYMFLSNQPFWFPKIDLC